LTNNVRDSPDPASFDRAGSARQRHDSKRGPTGVDDQVDKRLYGTRSSRASDRVVAGERDEAIRILEEFAHIDLPMFERTIMCMNIAE
jgi:hypothetical protein